MATQLIEIEKKDMLIAYNDDNIDPYIKQVRELIENFDYDLSTGVSRAKIASLSSKVSKFKVVLDDTGKDLTAEWKVKSKAVDKSRKKMRDELDKLRDLARKPLTDWEDEQKRLEAERAAKEEADRILAQFNSDHELALLLDENFDREVLEAKQKSDAEAKALIEQQQKEQAEHEEKIRLKAADDARIAEEQKAESERLASEAKAQKAIDDKIKAEQIARDAKAREKLLVEQAAQRKIDQEIEDKRLAAIAENNRLQAIEDKKQAEITANDLAMLNDAHNDNLTFDLERKQNQDRINADNLSYLVYAHNENDAFDAERKRVYDIEQARLREVERQKLEQDQVNAIKLAAEQNKENRRVVHQAIVKVLVDNGFNQKECVKIVTLMATKKLPKVLISY